jgi:hypothetical protein
MVEAIESCDINQGKLANQSKVHKICKTNFVDLYHNCRDFNFCEVMYTRFAYRDDSEELFNC